MKITGTVGRATPIKLANKLQLDNPTPDGCEYYSIMTEPIGEILAVTVTVRQRHLTTGWFLKYIAISHIEGATTRSSIEESTVSYQGDGGSSVRYFHCHSVIQSKVTLGPGEGILSTRLKIDLQKIYPCNSVTITYNLQFFQFVCRTVRFMKCCDMRGC